MGNCENDRGWSPPGPGLVVCSGGLGLLNTRPRQASIPTLMILKPSWRFPFHLWHVSGHLLGGAASTHCVCVASIRPVSIRTHGCGPHCFEQQGTSRSHGLAQEVVSGPRPRKTPSTCRCPREAWTQPGGLCGQRTGRSGGKHRCKVPEGRAGYVSEDRDQGRRGAGRTRSGSRRGGIGMG